MNPVSQRSLDRPGATSEALARDACLPVNCGDQELALPGVEEVVALVAEQLVAGRAPTPLDAVCIYARWKPRTSLTASFRVAFQDGTQRIVSLKRYAGSKAESLSASFQPDRYALQHAAPLRAFASFPERRTVLYAFPCDRELDGLARVLDWKRTARRIDRAGIFPGFVVRKRASSATVLRYKPERRAVLALSVELRAEGRPRQSRRLAARVLHPAKALELTRRRRLAMHVEGAPLAPELFDLDVLPGILLEEWIELSPHTLSGIEGLETAGGVLAGLHGGREPAGAARDSSRNGALEMLAAVPELAARAQTVAGVPPPRAQRWVHGDFHLGQVGLRRVDGAPVLLDLDELRPGDPMEDLASCLANELASEPALEPGRLVDALLAGYSASGGASPERGELERWIADELLGRAAGCLRRLEAGAIERAGRLVELARELSGPSGGGR